MDNRTANFVGFAGSNFNNVERPFSLEQIKNDQKIQEAFGGIKTVHVEVVKAQNLVNTDGFFTAVTDPYAYVWIAGFLADRKKTQTKDNTLNPEWREGWNFSILDPNRTMFVFSIMDEDDKVFQLLDDKVGHVVVSLGALTLKKGETVERWFPLTTSKGKRQKSKLLVRFSALDFDHKGDGSDPLIDTTIKKEKSRSKLSILTSGPITATEDAQFDNAFGVVLAKDLINTIQTGSIILHSGTNAFAKAIQMSTDSTWSHAALVICDPSDEVRKKFNLNDKSKRAYVLESVGTTKGGKSGVQILELEEFIKWYFEHDDKSFTVVRTISDKVKSRINNDALSQFLVQIEGTHYETNPIELILSIWHKNRTTNTSTIFCSELVAAALKSMSLLPTETVPSNWVPKNFSTEGTVEGKAMGFESKFIF